MVELIPFSYRFGHFSLDAWTDPPIASAFSFRAPSNARGYGYRCQNSARFFGVVHMLWNLAVSGCDCPIRPSASAIVWSARWVQPQGRRDIPERSPAPGE